MRWVRLFIAVLLLLHILIGSQGFAREIRKGHRKKTSISISATTKTMRKVGCDRCKKSHVNNSTTCTTGDNDYDEDDKRVVPTGPNPLHNRR